MKKFKNNSNKYICPQNRLSIKIHPNERVKFIGYRYFASGVYDNVLIQSIDDMAEYSYGVPILEITRKDWQKFVPIG